MPITMLQKIYNIFPVAGGAAGGGLGSWFALNHDMIFAAVISALIFAVVGGVVGFLVNKAMIWLSKKVMRK